MLIVSNKNVNCHQTLERSEGRQNYYVILYPSIIPNSLEIVIRLALTH